MPKDDDPFGDEPPTTDPFGRPISGAGETSGSPAPVGEPQPGSAAETWSTPPPPPPPDDDYSAPPPGRAQGAIPALVLGILGIVLCPLCAPVAWAFGKKAEGLVDASGGALGGRGEATAGKVLGMIGTGLMVIGIIVLVALIAIGTSVDTGGSTTTTFEFP